ncbi:winged helix-turn-helix domain-containing protein [Micromonospora sp. WMMD1128]|uniref:winged helix-turn-helix domain-containing protein n=1 Tax=unclassified Micromonospora TaxID=2617518 RepID=UPI00248B00C0|nr:MULTISPECIES: winged helix-turn-helix domain-containing protein [unclassified Micromonospora]WBB76208.1 winged helix-turn-helix domain-containing protein [Micromonospora sp. WMMD1128]WFE36007.1 winged helix-turn-helix domain-containing protein [Micromonospora sp. WMMD975]
MREVPDYWRIADDVIADVRSNKLKPGDKLPSIVELRENYRVSHGTVQMAYARLEALRVIRRQQGKGVFVTDPKTWMREP